MTQHRAGAALASLVLVLAAALYWLPSHVADAAGWSRLALYYVTDRLELAMLWLALAGLLAAAAPWARPAAWVMLWPAGEAVMGAAARLSLPMCCPLTPSDSPIAVQAWGPWADWVSLAMAGAAVCWVARQVRVARAERGPAHGHAQH